MHFFQELKTMEELREKIKEELLESPINIKKEEFDNPDICNIKEEKSDGEFGASVIQAEHSEHTKLYLL